MFFEKIVDATSRNVSNYSNVTKEEIIMEICPSCRGSIELEMDYRVTQSRVSGEVEGEGGCGGNYSSPTTQTTTCHCHVSSPYSRTTPSHLSDTTTPSCLTVPTRHSISRRVRYTNSG